jgi:hypothetical protein
MSGATGTRSLDRVSGEKSRCKTEARLVVSRLACLPVSIE